MQNRMCRGMMGNFGLYSRSLTVLVCTHTRASLLPKLLLFQLKLFLYLRNEVFCFDVLFIHFK